jgi:hypothetical protein
MKNPDTMTRAQLIRHVTGLQGMIRSLQASNRELLARVEGKPKFDIREGNDTNKTLPVQPVR